jgi:spore coat polysaccharide biosynthesis predicted glycosyltransferase SpsG
MGGSDPNNFTLRVIESLQEVRVSDLEVNVLVGGSNPHRQSLERAATAWRGRLRLSDSVADVASAMAYSDLAVAGAGTTCLEMCFMGLPAVLIDLAENQTPIAQAFARLGAAMHPGSSQDVAPSRVATEIEGLMCDAGRRRSMSQIARTLVDGKGALRVVEELRRT